MSEPVSETPPIAVAERFLQRWQGLRARLPGVAAERASAADRFRASGLPTISDEDWRYTSLRALEPIRFEEALTPVGEDAFGGAEALLASLRLPDAPRLVFVDGRFAADLSDATLDGERFGRFGAAPGFGPRGRDADEKLVLLNTMFAEDGASLRIDAGQDGGTVLLLSLGLHARSRQIAFHPRHRVVLGDGAQLRLIEVAAGQGAYLSNPVTEIAVGQDATLSHVRLQDDDRAAFHLSTTYVDLAERATYDSFGLNLGAAIARTEIHARLGGPHATAHLNGAQLLTGRQHADFTTVVEHAAPHCASRQTVKNVLAGRSRGVFQGRIDVDRVAQKTDGYQMNQALLLSPEAEINSKPQLRIHADDVKCSHGATVGELDHDQLFYLRSRGVPVGQARAMLVRAFLAEAIDPIADADGRALLEAAVERWWLREGAELQAA